MANYFYVNGGTADGSTTDASGTNGVSTGKLTGAYSSIPNTFATIEAAFAGTVKPVAGDFVLVADTHQQTMSASDAAMYNDLTAGSGRYYIVSTDVNNCETYKKATAYNVANTATNYSARLANCWVYGLYFHADDINIIEPIGSNKQLTFIDCTIHNALSNSYDVLINANVGSTYSNKLTFLNCQFTSEATGAAGCLFGLANGHNYEAIGCTVSGNWGSLASGGGSGNVYAYGCDLSTLNYVMNNGGNSATDSFINVNLYDCQMENGYTLSGETLSHYLHTISLYGCTDSTIATPSQIAYATWNGTLDSVIGTASTTGIRSDGTVMSLEADNTYMALKVVTNTDCTAQQPFMFDMPTQYADLTTTDSIRIYIASDTTLHTDDIKIHVVYRDGTNSYAPNYITSEQATNWTPLEDASTTELTTDSGSTWGGALTNKYYIDIDTSADAGGECSPIIKAEIRSTSATIYIDSEYDVV
jgi:hypothetical protein